MAESVVAFVARRLHDLLVIDAEFLKNISSQVEEIQSELKQLQCLLKDADARQDEDVMIQNWVAQLREVTYDVEDVIERFAIRQSQRRTGVFRRYAGIFNDQVALHRVPSEIQDLKTRISVLIANLQTHDVEAISQEGYVGRKGVLEKLVAHFVSMHCQVFVIGGMGGLGKTEIARQIYHHKEIRSHFQVFAWAHISHQWEFKDILRLILVELVPEKREVFSSLADEQLVEELYEVQQNKKCLMISTILVTTRNVDIYTRLDPIGFCWYEPRFLNEEESLELLCRKVFSRKRTKTEWNMEKLARKMVTECGGSPIAIITLGELLATRTTLNQWKEQTMASSYHALPYYLKPCFLYLAAFPKFGFLLLELHQYTQEHSLTDVAEYYLLELALRCMVSIEVNESSGKLKYCKLDGLMGDFCLSKAEEESFLRIITPNHPCEATASSSLLKAAFTGISRRLSIAGKVRSTLFFTGMYSENLKSALKFLWKDCKMLRVLQVEKASFKSKLPKGIGNLVHLRYLGLQESRLYKIPSSVRNLKFLQTLDLKVNHNYCVTIPDVIWRLENLRHLYLPKSYHFRNAPLQLSCLYKLETVKKFDTRVSDYRDLTKLPKVRNLGAIFKLRFDSEGELSLLRVIIACEHLHRINLQGCIKKLPEYHHFSSNLIKLTFGASELKEDPMPTLEKLPKLEFLSPHSAFDGPEMRCSCHGFPQLRKLRVP
ncbi:hypothetical protein Pfo_016196 [Paulownia fortunei]|nr:hypothetical protein Pfo_016196 [Paulownia fortunei]